MFSSTTTALSTIMPTPSIRPSMLNTFSSRRSRNMAPQVTITENGIDLEREGLRGPSSTWTYLVNDDPFRQQLGIQLAGSTGFAAAAALYAGPILILWGLYNRYRRRAQRRA